MRIVIIAWMGVCFVVADLALADVILLKDVAARPIYGRIVKQTETTIGFEEMASHDVLAPRRVNFSIDKVDLIIRNIDETRLAELNPGNLADYRNYAEELASQKSDPVARSLAIRLFLIVAYWAKENSVSEKSMQEGALNALVELARNDMEMHNLRWLAELYGGTFPVKDDLSTDDASASDSAADNDNQVMLQTVRLIRRGDTASALTELEKKNNAAALARWSEIVSRNDLMRMARQNRIPASDLRRLLLIEMAIENGQSVEQLIVGYQDSRDRGRHDWTVDAKRAVPATFLLPRLESVTEFDPGQAVYRNGRWVKPSEIR